MSAVVVPPDSGEAPRLGRLRRKTLPRVDGLRAPPLHRRFRTRVFLYIMTLSLITAMASAAIYYWRQVGFIEKDRKRHARTIVTSLATQAELGAYAGDSALCAQPAGRVFNHEDDVVLVAIYDRRGEEILHYAQPDLTLAPPDAQLMKQLHRPGAEPVMRQVRLGARSRVPEFDDLYAPIVTRVRDPADAMYVGRGGPHARHEVVGVARVGLSRRTAREQLAEVIIAGGFLGVGLLIVGVIAALLISRHVSRPIAALTSGAERIRAGHLDTRVAIKSDDELGQLGYSFNRMAARLAETMTALETLNRDLESEVAQRTLAIQRAASFTSLLNAPVGQKAASGVVDLPRDVGTGGARGPLAHLLDSSLCALIEGAGATGAAALLTVEESVDFELAVSWCIGVQPDNVGPKPSEEMLAQGVPVFEEGAAPPGPLDDAPRDRLILPLVLGSDPAGCVILLCAGPPDPDAVQFAAHAASQLAIAVGNVRAYAAQLHLARELQARNAALASQRDKLQEMNRLKSEFLANTSHELRTPLNAILGYAEMIADGIYGDVNDDQKQALIGIDESSRNLLALINNILDLAKVESGKMTVHDEDVDVVEILRAVMAEAAQLAKDKPFPVRLVAPARLPLRSDGPKVKQIVTNLVSNAIKFTAEGEVVVTVRAETPGGCTITVRDTGIGIRPEDQKIIFEEFRQLDGSYTRTYGGTGLGLAIARRLTELLGGHISVESQLGKGATFIVRLPAELPSSRLRRPTLPPPLPPEIVHR